MTFNSRRAFVTLAGTSSLATFAGLRASWMPSVTAAEAVLPTNSVKFRPEIEPLVRLLEDTPRERIVDATLDRIQNGTSYRELLAALFLAGIRNVQPRPAVGFKFHSVLVVHSAHQASIAANDEQRWFPLLWAIDYFKSAQATDVAEGDWTMAAVDESKLPEGSRALAELNSALDVWDVERADAAAAVAARVLSASELLDVLAKYATRDFRSIGHKSIYVAGAFRTLGIIGWEHSEAVVRSLAYAILNHTGEPNPSESDADADRAGRANWELVKSQPTDWKNGKRDPQTSLAVLEILRSASPTDSSRAISKLLQQGASTRSVYDGFFLMSAELVSRQPAIVPLHAVTTTNAIHYLFQHVHDEQLRSWLLLQNGSFLAHFRDASKLRGNVAATQIEALSGLATNQYEATSSSLGSIFDSIRKDASKAAQETFQYLRSGGSAEGLIRNARELVFLKGSDSHDYKFSSAAIEDYHHIAPEWRDHYLASCTYLLRGSQEKSTSLSQRVLGQS